MFWYWLPEKRALSIFLRLMHRATAAISRIKTRPPNPPRIPIAMTERGKVVHIEFTQLQLG